MSILDALMGYQGDHPKDVAKAYRKLSQQLQQDAGTVEDQQWREHFDNLQLQGASPGQGFDPMVGKQMPGQSPLERWKSQIDGMITSGNPVLQKQGLGMLANYQSRATAPEGSEAAMSQYGKVAQEMGLTPGTPAFYSAVQQMWDEAHTNQKRYQPRVVTPAEGQKLEWLDPNRQDPIVYQDVEDIRGLVRNRPEGTEMQDAALNIVDTLESALFNPEGGIYNDEIWKGTGASGVLGAAIASGIRDISQSDDRYKSYSDTRGGSASQIVRALGEKGALSDKDIERALALLPNISGLRGVPDLPATAKRKFAFLRQLLQVNPKEWGPILDYAEAQGFMDEAKVAEDPGEEVWEDEL